MELANTLCDEIFYVEAVMVKVPVFKGSCTAIVTPFSAVSYTHLDVYKRQALMCAAALRTASACRQT